MDEHENTQTLLKSLELLNSAAEHLQQAVLEIKRAVTLKGLADLPSFIETEFQVPKLPQ